jgi:serine/threonine protein kinase
MEDDLTQATQSQAQDPRRMGRNNSGLTEEDIADLLCILHPCSPAAFRIVAHTASRSPHNVLQGHGYDRYDDGVSQAVLEEQETFILQPSTSTSAAQAMDLALRFSATVIRPYMGFVFGRSAQFCDIVLDTDTVKRISNVHFRIFVNESGVLMLEDVSTNGTIVDDVVLRSKAGTQTRMLTAGSIIQIISPKAEEIVKFIVRIPNRENHIEEYGANVDRLLTRMAASEAEAHAQAGAVQVPKRTRPAAATTQSGGVPMSLGRFGMHWSGGDKYNVVGHIGKGAFAMVYQLATKSDGQLFAAKELEKRRFMKNGVLDRKIDNELQIMKAISHPNVVQYVEYQDFGQHLYIIMEFVPCGDLQHYLTNYGHLTEPLAKIMSFQVFDALAYLHKKKITHRDIKPDNILLADMSSANFTVKLSDFGLSKVVNNDETFLKTFCGTLLYCAPEVFPQYDLQSTNQGKKRPRRGNSMAHKFHSYSQSVDVWSYGAVLWFALCLQPPFEGVADATGDGMFKKIMMTSLDTTALHRKRVSQDAIDLMLEMLNTDPSARPSPIYCLSHSWFGLEASVVEGAARTAEEGGLEVIAEEPSFANLSLRERAGGFDSQTSDFDFDSGDYKFFDARQSKRFKSEVFRQNADGSPMASSGEIMFDNIPEEADPQTQNKHNVQSKGNVTSAVHPRLFGEISQSALAESGALSALPHTESYTSSIKSRGSSNGDNFREDKARGLLASPSLLGAESLVRDMHMDSPCHSGSSPGGDAVEPTTPASISQQRPVTEAQRTPVQVTPKPLNRSTFSRQIKLEISPSYFYDVNDPSTHNIEYASKVSGIDFAAKPGYLESEKSMPSDKQDPPSRAPPGGSHGSSTRDVDATGAKSRDSQDGVTDLGEQHGMFTEGAKGLYSQHDVTDRGEQCGWDNDCFSTQEQEQREWEEIQREKTQGYDAAPRKELQEQNGGSHHSGDSQVNDITLPPTTQDTGIDAPSEFLKPPPRVGKLASTPDSYTPKGPVTLNLNSRLTTWGRAPSNTQVYPDPTDTRVGKRALMLWFHAKDIDKIPEGDDSWTKLPGLHCIISTESSAGVFVNGVHLKRGEDGRRQFGRIYTGDQVVVWKEAGKALKFSCEFLQGEGKDGRPAGMPRFKIETEGSGGRAKGKEREL